jgi:hypothetical protein
LVGVSHQVLTPFHFCEKRVKNSAQVYQEDMLQGIVKPLNTTLFNGQEWVFQQDSTLAHKAQTNQEWLQRNVSAFISAEDWPSESRDLNPLDYKLWAVLEDMAFRKCHNNLESPRRSLVFYVITCNIRGSFQKFCTLCFLFKNEFILQNTFTGLQCNLHCALSLWSSVWASLVFLFGHLRCWCVWLLRSPH